MNSVSPRRWLINDSNRRCDDDDPKQDETTNQQQHWKITPEEKRYKRKETMTSGFVGNQHPSWQFTHIQKATIKSCDPVSIKKKFAPNSGNKVKTSRARSYTFQLMCVNKVAVHCQKEKSFLLSSFLNCYSVWGTLNAVWGNFKLLFTTWFSTQEKRNLTKGEKEDAQLHQRSIVDESRATGDERILG